MEQKPGGAFQKSFFVLAVLLGLALVALGVIAALCSTVISVGMWLPALGGLALTAWGLLRLRRPGPAIGHKGLRRAVVACVCAGLLAVALLEALMLSALLAPAPGAQPGVVLVLGCGLFPDGRLTLSLQSRLDAAYDALERYPDALCIVSGGQGDNEPLPEAQAMRDYLVSRGIDGQRVVMERESRNTAENMRFSAAIMERLGASGAAVVTNDFHVYRALHTARRYGIEGFGVASPTHWRVWLASRVREYIGILKEAFLPNK